MAWTFRQRVSLPHTHSRIPFLRLHRPSSPPLVSPQAPVPTSCGFPPSLGDATKAWPSIPVNTHLAQDHVAGSVVAVYRRIALAWPCPEEGAILVESDTRWFPLCLRVLVASSHPLYAHHESASRAVGAIWAHHDLCSHVWPRSSGFRGATLLSHLSHTLFLSTDARITTRIFRPPSTTMMFSPRERRPGFIFIPSSQTHARTLRPAIYHDTKSRDGGSAREFERREYGIKPKLCSQDENMERSRREAAYASCYPRFRWRRRMCEGCKRAPRELLGQD